MKKRQKVDVNGVCILQLLLSSSETRSARAAQLVALPLPKAKPPPKPVIDSDMKGNENPVVIEPRGAA